jgi:GINS complex subunit 2
MIGCLIYVVSSDHVSVTCLPDYLSERLGEETSQKEFSRLPFRYAEVSKILLDMYAPRHRTPSATLHTFTDIRRAPDDIYDPDRIRILLKDIREARQAKIRTLFPDLGPYHLEVRSS